MTTIEEGTAVDATPTAEPLAPVAANERVETIDILRGMALFGILAANMRGFAGPAAVYFTPDLFWTSLHDRIAQAFIDTFIQGKFITIFAFLFGVGFAVQLERSATRSGNFGRTYARRLFILLLFGLVHGLLIWWGDILLVYALTGFLLLFFRKRSNTTVIRWGIAAYLVMVVLAIAMFTSVRFGHQPNDFAKPTAAELRKTVETFAHGSWADIEAQRASDALLQNWIFTPIFFTHVLGLFLFGMLAWRKGLFTPSREALPQYRMWMWIGLVVGLLGNATTTFVDWRFDVPEMPITVLSLTISLLASFAEPALSMGYLCLVIVLCQDDVWRARLRRFGAVGRTALSNYLLQSIVGTLIFYSYGFRLFGRVGPAILLAMTIVIYAVQVVLSQWWLARYRYGPAEWLWRSLTYGKRLPLVREPSLPAADVLTT